MATMRTRAVAYLPPLPVGINYDLGPDALTCNFLQNASCPVRRGQRLEYKLRMFIEEAFPVVSCILSTVRYAIHLQFDISANAPEIRAV
jgi:hypothetical protein